VSPVCRGGECGRGWIFVGSSSFILGTNKVKTNVKSGSETVVCHGAKKCT
jgi:hypothetical protein